MRRTMAPNSACHGGCLLLLRPASLAFRAEARFSVVDTTESAADAPPVTTTLANLAGQQHCEYK